MTNLYVHRIQAGTEACPTFEDEDEYEDDEESDIDP